MRRLVFPLMKPETTTRQWLRALSLAAALALTPAFAADTPAINDADTIVSTTPVQLETEGDAGLHGQLAVAQELLTSETRNALVYTITSEPTNGRVGLSGGVDADFFRNKTARVGYFAYRPRNDYAGVDSFAYTVRNETTGLVFKNTVVITVKEPPPIVMQKFEVGALRDRAVNVRDVALTTRPNTPVEEKVPSHEQFMSEADRLTIPNAKVAYMIDDREKPQHGTARLDRTTGLLTYSPNPGFIGVDRFKYYTIDENNAHLGVENFINIAVEPIRHLKHTTADRSRSREVDLVFVINNSRSMAAHQDRIAANLNRFRQLFVTRDLDYRIAVLTTDFVNSDGRRRAGEQFYKQVRSTQIDAAGNPVLDNRGQPRTTTKRVASNGSLVTLPVLAQPWVTPTTPDGVFSELVKVGTNGASNRTAFTAVYNFVAGFHNKEHTLLRPEATTIVVFFMDEEETRMATWKEQRNGPPEAQWIENGKLPTLLREYNARNPRTRQTLDGYINYWVLRPFIIAKGNRRGKLEMHAVVSSDNVSHRRAAELTGGTVLNIDSDFSGPLAALGDRIADTVAVALDPVQPNATLYQKSLRVVVDGKEVAADPQNGWMYDELTHSIRFQGDAKKAAFAAKIDVSYEEHQQ